MDSCFALIWAHQHTIDVHGFYSPGDMAVGMREVLARPWVGVCAVSYTTSDAADE